jgi:hypothetical protein
MHVLLSTYDSREGWDALVATGVVPTGAPW